MSPPRPVRVLVAALLFLSLLRPGALPAQAPSTDQCRQATQAALAMFKAALPEMSERDREGARAVVAEIERLLQDHRARGVDPCVTWRDIVARVFRS